MGDYRLIRDGIVKTRKRHECAWCAEPVEKGSSVPSRTYHWDGYIQTDHMHPECREAMDNADQDDLMDGWMPGDFQRGSYE